MRCMHPLLALLATLSPALVQAGWLADVEVYDRTSRRMLPIHEHEGRLYLAGEPRHRYELRIRNQSGGRVLAVTSVDGVNVISGETAAARQSGYVVDAWDSVRIEGWRKNLEEVATFYFTRLEDSYAARTGRPHEIGVIGVALFREHAHCCVPEDRVHDERGAAADAPPAGTQAREAARGSIHEPQRYQPKLGTGHGHRESSPAQYVDFQRASATPDATIVIYYDSRKNLLAQGVLPSRPRFAARRPNPFPDGFVADP